MCVCVQKEQQKIVRLLLFSGFYVQELPSAFRAAFNKKIYFIIGLCIAVVVLVVVGKETEMSKKKEKTEENG